MTKTDKDKTRGGVSRRGFLKAGGAMAAVTGGAAVGCSGALQVEGPKADGESLETGGPTADGEKNVAGQGVEETPRIRGTRILGRTGFAVSDICIGLGNMVDPNVLRYACDRGVNLVDTAEGYGGGDSERKVGEAMVHLDRKNIFLVTKLHIKEKDTEQSIRDRFGRCLSRLKTDYVDALYMHGPSSPKMVSNPEFHAAVAKLKADGRVKHVGVSSHGSRNPKSASMSEVLLAAVADGRFDLMLLVYNFLRAEEGEVVLEACKEKNIGAIAMKTSAGRLCVDPFDPDNPSLDCAYWIDKLMHRRGLTREEAVSRIQKQLESSAGESQKNRPAQEAFQAKYGVNTQAELDTACVAWVLENPAMHSACVSMSTFDQVDQYLPVSGAGLSARARALLRDYASAFGGAYCRHGCSGCAGACPCDVPVSTVMRYSYYFSKQGREKHAIEKYGRLLGDAGCRCIDCDAPCEGSCPFGVQVQASLIKADRMLRMG